MRKLTGILLMLVLLAAVLCAAAAETAGTCGEGITWTLDGDRGKRICRMHGAERSDPAGKHDRTGRKRF